MSRLDSFIRRMEAQRELLGDAMADIADKDGVVLELGLGNGRTYDHMREHMPGRDIFVFEREVRAHPDCIPPDHLLYLGHVIERLADFTRDIGRRVILIHSDIGNGDEPASIDFGRTILGPALAPVMLPGCRVISDQPLGIPGATELQKPPHMDPERAYIYRMEG
jgi:hypothetical protein